MNLRSLQTHVIGAAVALAVANLNLNAQAPSSQASSATHVAAEMTNGKLNPADSKPGDTVALTLKNDLKANGEVVLKKGTTITGIVKNVKCAEPNTTVKGEARSQAQSMMEIEWLAPATQGRMPQNLSIVLQSVLQVNPIVQHDNDSLSEGPGLKGGSASTMAARPAPATGELSGSAGGVVGTTVSTHSGVQSNAALLNMPSVVAVDHQTSSAIETGLGSSSSGQLFKVGHGELVAGGSQQSVDIFSHLSNDTVITSPSKSFEITSGAQMQLLVGVNRK